MARALTGIESLRAAGDANYALIDFWTRQAEAEVFNTYGDVVSVFSKAKSLTKFGAHPSLGTSQETVWSTGANLANESYLSTNGIDKISSSSGSDTVDIKIEGHTVSGGVFTFVVQTVTLTGQTAATLSTPLARVSRVYNVDATDLVGSLYVHEADTLSSGVPTTVAKIHARVPAGENQSFKCATTVSNTDYMFITSAAGACIKKTSGLAEFKLQIREAGGVFRSQFTFAADTDGASTFSYNFRPYLLLPKNADIRMVATASAASTPVSGSFSGVLASVLEGS